MSLGVAPINEWLLNDLTMYCFVYAHWTIAASRFVGDIVSDMSTTQGALPRITFDTVCPSVYTVCTTDRERELLSACRCTSVFVSITDGNQSPDVFLLPHPIAAAHA